MIRSLGDVMDLAREKGPMSVAVLAPEDEEFMQDHHTSFCVG